jgi:uncharacterized protein (TIGR02594 family)
MTDDSSNTQELKDLLRQRALSDTSSDQGGLKIYVDYLLREQELRLKIKESGKWLNPVFVTIIVAFISLLGNAVLGFINSSSQRVSDNLKHEQNLIIESLKAQTPDKVLTNLDFLLQAKLLNKDKYADLRTYIEEKNLTGGGPQISTSTTVSRIADCRLPDGSQYEQAAKAAGTWRWMQIALGEICVSEHGSEADRNRIVEYLRTAFPNLEERALTPSTPWASAFVIWVLKKAGVPVPSFGTAGLAETFVNFGDPVDKPVLGCLVITRRSTGITSTSFYLGEGENGSTIRVLMGNASDSVRVAIFPKSTVVGYRMPRS